MEFLKISAFAEQHALYKALLAKSLGVLLVLAGTLIFYTSTESLLELIGGVERWKFSSDFSLSQSFFYGAVKGIIAAVPVLAGSKCFFYGKKLQAAARSEQLTGDDRSPVLYLRSFQDDRAMAESPVIGAPVLSTGEEQLASVMNEIGPFTAVGKPGEPLPELGARRLYFKNEEWQEKVRDLMAQARLVVLRAAESEGFWWEFQRAMTMLAPDRIVLLIPFKAPEYETFRRKAEKALPRGLPGYAGKANPPFDLRGLIYFDHDGTAHFAPLAGVMRDIPYYSLRAPLAAPLKRVLRPVYEQLGVSWQQKIHWVSLLLIATGLMALSGSLLYLALALSGDL